MGATFEATRLLFRRSQGCRSHVSEVVVDGQVWDLDQALITLRLGNRMLLRDASREKPLPLVTSMCDCGELTLVTASTT
jgi:hypothetical protein